MGIEKKTRSELSSKRRQIFDSANESVKRGNLDYAIEILEVLLIQEPGFVAGHRLLRSAYFERTGGKPGAVSRALASVTTFLPLKVKAPGLLKKGNVSAAMIIAEKALRADPTSVTALHFLARCSEQAGWTDVAIDILEFCRECNPSDVKTYHKLARQYDQAGDYSSEVNTLSKLHGMIPNDLEIAHDLKQATAKAAMDKDNWEDAESFRDVIKDKDEARRLEQQERMGARDAETFENLISKAKEEAEKSGTASAYKKLAELYHKNGDLDEALESYQTAAEKSGTLDPVIDDAIISVLLARFDAAIAQWEEYAEQNPAKKSEAESHIEEITRQKADTRRERFLQRVKRYPNEGKYHYDLAELYFEGGEVDKALTQFQAAQNDPRLRTDAQINVAKCMAAKGLDDMAIQQFEDVLANRAKQLKKNAWKEVAYHLAGSLEKVGRNDEALKYLKEIYSRDVDFLDVAQRIEQSYKSAEG